MSKKGEPRAGDFDKFHQKTRLELIVKDCWKCDKKTVYVYLGNYGTQDNPKFTYECNSCGIHYITSKKIKTKKNAMPKM